jgi:PspA-Associated protein
VIVRIATEGQYELEDGAITAMNELDNEAVAACDAGDKERFRATFTELLDLIRTEGRQLGEDELEGSDLILPPPDISLEEAMVEFSGEGLIPG